MGLRSPTPGPTASGRQWDAFLEAQPTGSFYHCHGWKQLNEGHFGHSTRFLEARDGDSLVGVLPLVLTRSRIFGRILCSMPFVNYGGPVAADAEVTRRPDRRRPGVRHERRVRTTLNCAALRRSTPTCTVALHKISMTIDLAADPDQLWNKFTSKHRTTIRRVYKDGFTVTAGGASCCRTFTTSCSARGAISALRSIRPPISRPSSTPFPTQTRIFVCYHGGEPVAVAFNGYFAGKVEGMWAGTTRVGHDLHANYVLYWEMIKDACERGCRRYHLGRSTAGSGAEQFKKKWNAETSQLYWYYHRPGGHFKPVVNVNHPSFQLGIAAWRECRCGPPA